MVTCRRIASAASTASCLALVTGCVAIQSAKGWKFGEYQQFKPPPITSEYRRFYQAPPTTNFPAGAPLGGLTGGGTAGTTLRLSRVAVQRPQVAPGQAVKLIAEYEISSPGNPLSRALAGKESVGVTVKETRVIRFEGQHVATLERVVSIPRGKGGSSVVLKVPADAAPGFYTVTTTVESRDASPGSENSANSVFRVGAAPASTPSAVPLAAVPVQFKLWADKTSYKIGERLKVFFWSSREGYATLVNVETSGKITILYPNAYSPHHTVKAGQTYSVPGAGDPYELTLGGPEGVKLVYALFTTAPTRFVEESFITNTGLDPVNDRAEMITRDINLTVKKIPLEEQASAVLEIDVTP